MAKKNPSRKDSNDATVGFEAKLWAAADALRNNMDAARGLLKSRFVISSVLRWGLIAAERGEVVTNCDHLEIGYVAKIERPEKAPQAVAKLPIATNLKELGYGQ